jgi:hypothetical protein
MSATCAVMFMIRPRVILTTGLRLEQSLMTYPPIGFVRIVELERAIFRPSER